MIGFILIIVLDIILWWLAWWCDKKNFEGGLALSCLTAALGAFAILFISIALAFKNDDARTALEDRDFYQECIYSLNDRMSFATMDRIMTKARDLNIKIARNKEHADDKMFGVFYNRKVGEIEPIDIPELRVSTSIYKKEKERE